MIKLIIHPRGLHFNNLLSFNRYYVLARARKIINVWPFNAAVVIHQSVELHVPIIQCWPCELTNKFEYES